jgi:FSR family fosmidomycin resistance protein-like MFS transporter
MNRRYISLLTSGHFVTDIYQGALPAMLPFLISERHLSYSAAALLVFIANISSSIIQPLFGFYSDKISAPWAMPLGILLAGLGIGFMGLLPSYWALMIAVAISGIGIAAFHPEGARLANNVSGDKKATGVSTFSAGGNMGFAVGPMITTALLITMGLKGSVFLIIPAVIMTFVLLLSISKLSKYSETCNSKKQVEENREIICDEWNPFLRLLTTISCRSIIFFGFNTFLPLYFIHYLRQSNSMGSLALSILIITGAISTLIAGRLADRYGQHKIIFGGFALLIPLLFIFINVSNVKIATFMLIPIGMALYAPFSPMVVLGQKYLPNHMGLASGVTLGLAVSIGGIFAPILGWISDHYGIHAAISYLTIIPIIATIVAMILPIPKVDSEKSVIY